MKEIIDSILDAEKKAEQIILEALSSASKITSTCVEQGEKAKTLVALSFSAERKLAILDAEKTAKEKYDETVSKATLEANALKSGAEDKIQNLVDQIVDGLIK